MIRNYAIIREAAARVARAVDDATGALRDGRVEHEPSLTDRMLGRIEAEMEGFRSKGVTWRAKTLTDRGPNSQEKQYGADFAGVLSVDLPDFKVNKGFLAQAKLIEQGDALSPGEFKRMQVQCKKMLNLTPDSFVFLYTYTGVTVVPAVSVVSSSPRNPHDFYSRSVSRFYEEHFESFIGDPRLAQPTAEGLEDLRRQVEARRLLFLGARGE